MVNNNNIIPVTQTDLLTLYGTALKLAGTSYTVIAANDVAGNFSPVMPGETGNKLANAPVKTFNFRVDTVSAVVYFVAAYDYAGFSVNGTAVVTSGATVNPDCATLYSATLSDGAVAIAAITPALS